MRFRKGEQWQYKLKRNFGINCVASLAVQPIMFMVFILGLFDNNFNLTVLLRICNNYFEWSTKFTNYSDWSTRLVFGFGYFVERHMNKKSLTFPGMDTWNSVVRIGHYNFHALTNTQSQLTWRFSWKSFARVHNHYYLKFMKLLFLYTYSWIVTRYCTWSTFRVINVFIDSSLYSCMSHKQDKEMDNLNLFIDYHYKSIVSIIRVKHIITLHLSTANWRIKLTTGCCCKNAAALYCTRYAIYFYQIESYHSSSSCGLFQCTLMEQ